MAAAVQSARAGVTFPSGTGHFRGRGGAEGTRRGPQAWKKKSKRADPGRGIRAFNRPVRIGRPRALPSTAPAERTPRLGRKGWTIALPPESGPARCGRRKNAPPARRFKSQPTCRAADVRRVSPANGRSARGLGPPARRPGPASRPRPARSTDETVAGRSKNENARTLERGIRAFRRETASRGPEAATAPAGWTSGTCRSAAACRCGACRRSA